MMKIERLVRVSVSLELLAKVFCVRYIVYTPLLSRPINCCKENTMSIELLVTFHFEGRTVITFCPLNWVVQTAPQGMTPPRKVPSSYGFWYSELSTEALIDVGVGS